MLLRKDIRIRDPFILTDKENGCYYMYGTTALKEGSLSATNSFSAYVTKDLENFEGPYTVFDGGAVNYYADKDYWAPEVHKYNGKYYLFASFKGAGLHRGTATLVSDNPLGPFEPLSDRQLTPKDEECLDGTFWVEDSTPYMIYSREWVSIKDGEIWAVKLSSDLSKTEGEPFKLFAASEAKDVTELSLNHPDCYVTDGPFLYKDKDKTKMIWSSFNKGRYVILTAETSSIYSKWTHLGSLLSIDGGHAMIFETLSGEKMISLHSPNKAGEERFFFQSFI